MEHDTLIALAARAAHEVNRTYCIALGDVSQKEWLLAPEWQKQSAIKGVENVIAGSSFGESHASWLREKESTGWVFGAVKDEAKKTHPCMVPYADLPADQRAKDELFVRTTRAVLHSLGFRIPSLGIEG